ncbi:MAG: hypothetical protein HQL93_00615 [Magnetococcales bacterium]|nr:hypothetical protein [Magnetococcales bacterium]
MLDILEQPGREKSETWILNQEMTQKLHNHFAEENLEQRKATIKKFLNT